VSNEITQSQKDRLEVLESGIAQCYRRALDMFAMLREIRDEKLYKVKGYSRFEAYCEEEWAIKKSQAYRYIEAGETLERVSPLGDIFDVASISTERHLRELTHVPDEKMESVLEAASKIAGSESKVTASMLKQAREEVLGTPNAVKKEPISIAKEVESPGAGEHGLSPEKVEQSLSICLKACDQLDRHLSRFDFFTVCEDKVKFIRDQLEWLR